MTRLEPLTRGLYLRFEGRPPPFTMRGIAVVDDEEVLGIVVLTNCRGADYIFAEVTEKLKERKRHIVRAWRTFIGNLPAGRDYYAVQDTGIETSHRFLTHFGFELVEDDIYVYRSKS